MGKHSDSWYLTGRVAEDELIRDVEIDSSPFRIGRQDGLSLTLPRPAVSSQHAEILIEQNSLAVRDLNSTNGTYVNGVRVRHELPLQEGDLIQFADVPFRLNRELTDKLNLPEVETVCSGDLAISVSQFDRFLLMRTVVPHFQPIVSLADRSVVGYEVLARSRVTGLETPKEMFLAASQLNLEEQLSQMLRQAGIEKGMMMGSTPSLFVNTHPAEIVSFGLLDSLGRLRQFNSGQPLTLEIREPDVADTTSIRELRDRLTSLQMRLAYDHFGAGKSNRAELASVHPDFVKFDMHLIRDIHLAPTAQRAVLTNLVRMVKQLHIVPVAMGVENESEHAICCEIGFELGQGYYYGKPKAAAQSARLSREFEMV